MPCQPPSPTEASDLLLQELIGSALRGELLGLEEWQTVTSVLADPPHASFELLNASAADVNTIRINFSDAAALFYDIIVPDTRFFSSPSASVGVIGTHGAS